MKAWRVQPKGSMRAATLHACVLMSHVQSMCGITWYTPPARWRPVASHQRQGPFHVRRGSMLSVLSVMAREARPQYAGSSCGMAGTDPAGELARRQRSCAAPTDQHVPHVPRHVTQCNSSRVCIMTPHHDRFELTCTAAPLQRCLDCHAQPRDPTPCDAPWARHHDT